MKTILNIIILIYPLALMAQAPLGFNYQAVARDAQGKVYANKNISLEISLLRNFDTGPVDFTEEHFLTTNELGLFSVQIGMGDPILGNLDALDWANNQYYFSTGFDPEGGRNFTELGITKLLSVPYAMHAKTASNAGGAGSDDQLLDLNGNVLSIENGNAVDLSALGAGAQTLSINGDQLSISGGNTISLSVSESDPQTLSLNGNQLSISAGNSVTLPSGGGMSPWALEGNDISYTDGKVGINHLSLRDDGDELITMRSWPNPTRGFLAINNNDEPVVALSNDSDGSGYIGVFTNQGTPRVALGSLFNTGRLSVFGSEGAELIWATANSGGSGYLGLFDPDENELVRLNGNIVTSFGPNGFTNCRLTNLASNTNHGYITVDDAAGKDQAGIYVNPSGQGVVYADITAAASPHPARSGHQIVYAGLTGPEAAAYIRGRATLVNGRAKIKFPEHFQMMVNSEAMTIMMTPYSIESKGLAIINKNKMGFEVGELFEGSGNYDFDWEVKAVRKGYEDFEVVQQEIVPTRDHDHRTARD